MIRYACPQCGAKLESPESMAGELDKCPMCGYECAVPRPKPPKRRAFLILGGVAGLLAGAALAVVITFGLISGTGPSPSSSPSNDSPGPKTTAKAVAKPAAPAWQSAPIVADASPSPVAPATLPPGFVLDTPAPTASADPAPATLSPEQVFEKASPAVVYLTVRDKDFKPIGLGSGFFVAASGLIVTNYHVIKGAEFATARLSSGATLFIDGVVATDPNGDLALLKVSGGGYPCLKRAAAALPKIGSAVYAIGNPRGLENTFSSGMISGHREIKHGLRVIQVTAPISPGSSGGPLLNASGEVVGVTTAYLTGGQNLNFAIPVSGVSALMRKQGKVRTIASAGGSQFDIAETKELDKAWAAMRKKDWSAATKALTELRKTQPDNPLVWYALGYLQLQLGNNEIAIEQYKHAIALKLDYVGAYAYIGITYGRMKRYPEAIEAYKKAIAIGPDYADVYCGMGDAYDALKRYPEAIEAYKKAIANEPNYARAYWSMGETYRETKRYPEAIEAYKKATTIDPNDADAYWGIGDCYDKLNRYPEAIEAYKKAIEAYKKAVASEPNDAEAYAGIAHCYDALKRYPEAIEAYKKAIAIEPNNAENYAWIGRCYRETKRYAEAIAACEQFLRLEPTGVLADLVRKDLPRLRRLAGK